MPHACPPFNASATDGEGLFSSVEGQELLVELTRYRRDLHRIPELDDYLPRTIAYVRSVLSGLSCDVLEPCKGAVCAFFDLGRSETVAIRADMDALPIDEASGAAFSSEHPGRMHACGTMATWPWRLRRPRGSIAWRGAQTAPVRPNRFPETFSSCSSRRRRPRAERSACARAAFSSAIALRASLACTSGPICPRAASRRGLARCSRARVRRPSRSTACRAISRSGGMAGTPWGPRRDSWWDRSGFLENWSRTSRFCCALAI